VLLAILGPSSKFGNIWIFPDMKVAKEGVCETCRPHVLEKHSNG
jgi:hypothetical protein